MNDFIGRVKCAKEGMDGLTIEIEVEPGVDTKKIFDEFFNRRMTPGVVFTESKDVDYSGMFRRRSPLTAIFASSDSVHLDTYPHNIIGIYVNRKKETVALKWSDGEITKVHRRKGDKFDLEAAVNAAIIKRLIGSHTEYQKKIEAIAEYQN